MNGDAGYPGAGSARWQRFCSVLLETQILFEDIGGDGQFFLSVFSASAVECFEAWTRCSFVLPTSVCTNFSVNC